VTLEARAAQRDAHHARWRPLPCASSFRRHITPDLRPTIRMNAPRKLRKQYINTTYPLVVLRFEDGHEIKVYQHSGKVFDAWAGERVKLMAVHDVHSKEWELLETRTGEQFDDPATDA
jgi:hypothetical protein